MNKFISGRIKSLGYAFKGAYLLLKTEHAVITQALLGLLFIFLGFTFISIELNGYCNYSQ